MSWEDRAAAWTAWARDDRDSYWFYRDAFFSLLPAAPQRTLEVGCGEGRVARDLRARGYDVVAVEPSETLVAAAREADPEGDYRVASGEALEMDDGAFDLVVAYNVLMDVEDMPRVVAECARVLRPGGVLCASVTHPTADAGEFVKGEGETFVLSGDYLEDRRGFEGTFERRDGLAPMCFSGWAYPLEAYSRALEAAGLVLEVLREPAAPAAFLEGRTRFWQRVPLFLTFRGAKR